jgi:hypothetical protein
MEERESTLEDKELSILNLRRKNVTLDNFRFVLDHRVQQLMEERGPITQHVEGLEAHISAMYDELEAEYYEKKRQGQQLDSKEMKIHTLGQEAAALRGLLREREAYIASFKRELSTLVGFTTPKDLEDAIKDAYHKFVKDEAPRHKSKRTEAVLKTKVPLPDRPSPAVKDDAPQVGQSVGVSAESMLSSGAADLEIRNQDHGHSPNNDRDNQQMNITELELRDALIEAHSQRDCVQRAAGNLKHRLDIAKSDAQRLQRVKLGENSHLIKECNQLRSENLTLSREVNHLRQVVKDHDAASAKRREKNRSHERINYNAENGQDRRSGENGQTVPPDAPPRTQSLHSTIVTPGVPSQVIDPESQPLVKTSSVLKSRGTTHRGSTRSLNHVSEQDAKMIQVSQ